MLAHLQLEHCISYNSCLIEKALLALRFVSCNCLAIPRRTPAQKSRMQIFQNLRVSALRVLILCMPVKSFHYRLWLGGFGAIVRQALKIGKKMA